jgi:hypothetical protein
MNDKNKDVSPSGLILRQSVNSICFIGRQRLKKQEGFIDFKVLIFIALLILILLIFFL